MTVSLERAGERTFPNGVTREGILGLEYLEWSDWATPRHNVTIPFTRMILGPMDYTPGGFRNVSVAGVLPLPRRRGSRGEAVGRLEDHP